MGRWRLELLLLSVKVSESGTGFLTLLSIMESESGLARRMIINSRLAVESSFNDKCY